MRRSGYRSVAARDVPDALCVMHLDVVHLLELVSQLIGAHEIPLHLAGEALIEQRFHRAHVDRLIVIAGAVVL